MLYTFCQHLFHPARSFPGQIQITWYWILVSVISVSLAMLDRKPDTPTPDIKKPDTRSGFFLFTYCSNHHLSHSFKVSINYHIYFVMCITGWTMPIFHFACAVISKIMNKVLVALRTFLQTHYLATSLTIAIIISLTLVCAFGSNNAIANLSRILSFTFQSNLTQSKL